MIQYEIVETLKKVMKLYTSYVKACTNGMYQVNCEFVDQCGLEPFVNQCGLAPFVSQCGYEPNVKLRDQGSFVNCEPMWPRAVCE